MAIDFRTTRKAPDFRLPPEIYQILANAIQQKNQMYQGLGQAAGQTASAGIADYRQEKARKQFGQALSNANAPAQGPVTESGSWPQRPPVDFGKLYSLAGRAFPNQAPELMPSIVKEFGQGSGSKFEEKQDKLEKDYRDELNKVVSFRSGGIGLQDAKVNQAIDLRTMINQTYDPTTGRYNIPPSLHSEMVLGLARLLSPTGQIGVELEKELRQKTLREGAASALIYLGLADPKAAGGPTQDVAKLFIDSIDRQGKTSEKLRDKYLEGLKSRYPTRLDPKRREFLEKTELTSSFNHLLKESPDYRPVFKKPGARPRANFKNPNDLSSMSNEELERIAGGQ